MKITVLGCWAPYPRAGGACSGYLLEGGGVRIMLEAGSGTLSRLMQHVDFRTLDAVIVTHLHHDHYLDLFPLRHAIEGARLDGSRDKPLDLYIPPEPAVEFSQMTDYHKAFQVFSIESLAEAKITSGFTAKALDLGNLTLRFVATKHLLPGYAVSFQEIGGTSGKFVFSGDTAPTDQLTALAQAADLFLCEASGLDSDEKAMAEIHCTAGQAGEIARTAGVKRLLLTHFWPEYHLAELQRMAETKFGSGVDLASEGTTYYIKTGEG